ncbi:MAG: tyrosine-type recombinase/integrase [Anaerolineae bacterium]|nr:tyrosine-type recombinase/integrase [Anaerolineae bacterium]
MRLSDAIDKLAIATRAEGRSPRTIQAYREKLGHLVRALGDPLIEAVTVDDLRRFLAGQRDKGLSEFTIKSRVRAIKRLWNFAEAEGIITENPARRIQTPAPKRETPKGIEWGDFVALLKTTEAGDVLDLRDRAIILFLADTGCRVGGLCGLELDALDLERRRALVTEKRGKPRFVFFQESTARALATWLQVRPGDRGPGVWVSFKGGCQRLTPSGVYNMLVARGEQAGCKGPVNPHAFRHAFARAYLTRGGDLGTLSNILGHSSVAVTVEYYAVFNVDELQRQHARYSPIAGLEVGRNDN